MATLRWRESSFNERFHGQTNGVKPQNKCDILKPTQLFHFSFSELVWVLQVYISAAGRGTQKTSTSLCNKVKATSALITYPTECRNWLASTVEHVWWDERGHFLSLRFCLRKQGTIEILHAVPVGAHSHMLVKSCNFATFPLVLFH